MRPKVLIDIKSKNRSFYNRPFQVNLSYQKLFKVPFKLTVSSVLIILITASFIFNFAMAPIDGDAQAAQTSAEKLQERKELEAQLASLEKQMEDYESKISDYKKQGNTLQSEINRLNNQMSKINVQIRAITLTLQKVNRELNDTQSEISGTETKIDVRKRVISEVLQNIYQNEQQGVLTMFLANDKMSDFMADLNNLNNIQDKLRQNIEELVGLHTQLSDQKEQLASEKVDVLSLKEYQEMQKTLVSNTKQEKDKLLKDTKGKESEYQKILAETQKTAAQIRSRIFELVGGGQLSFGDAYKYAQFAESKTGVRAALILAVLDRESSLGKNVGQCKYDQNPYYPGRASNKTTMHPTRDIPLFLEITKELGLNPDTLKVSCPIIADGAYGGGMGPSQFIPSTWNLYKNRIANLTGNNPPSPWKNVDAFMATALYLKDAGADKGTLYSERVAAAKYYAGSRWQNYLMTYGDRVVTRAQQFEQDIKTLTA